MPSGTLYHVVLIGTDVSENVLPLSSGFLRLIGFHSYVTMESILISLSREGYNLWSNNAVFLDTSMAVSIDSIPEDSVLQP
jgi:hypothetical protein